MNYLCHISHKYKLKRKRKRKRIFRTINVKYKNQLRQDLYFIKGIKPNNKRDFFFGIRRLCVSIWRNIQPSETDSPQVTLSSSAFSSVSTEYEQKNSSHESSPGWEEILSPRKIAPLLDHSSHSRNEIARLPFVSRFLHLYATYTSHCYSIKYSTHLKNANGMLFPRIVRDAST